MNYYRCEKGTEAYHILGNLMKEICKCYKAADDLATELGAVSFTTNSVVIGGLGSLRFNRKPDPKEYRVIGKAKAGGIKMYDCVPNIDTKEGAAIAVRMIRLPFIKQEDVLKRCGVQEPDEQIDDKSVVFLTADDYIYMESGMEHALEGLESISQQNFEDAKEYAGAS